MKRLNTREKIADALNFGKYPVLKIDLADRDSYGLKGCKVRVDLGKFSSGERYLENAELRVFRDEKKFQICSYGSCLHADFCYSDLMEDLEYANAPVIGPDQDIVIVIYDSCNRVAFAPYLVRTGSWVARGCQTPIDIERVDLSEYFNA